MGGASTVFFHTMGLAHHRVWADVEASCDRLDGLAPIGID